MYNYRLSDIDFVDMLMFDVLKQCLHIYVLWRNVNNYFILQSYKALFGLEWVGTEMDMSYSYSPWIVNLCTEYGK